MSRRLSLSRSAVVGAGALALFPASVFAQASPSAFTSAARYDYDRRIVGTISPDPDGSGPLAYAAVRNTYDANGWLVRVETGELSSWQSEAIAPSDWSGFTIFKTVDIVYDQSGRKLRETVTAGGTAQLLQQSSYDSLNRLTCTATRMNPAAFNSPPADACTLGTEGSFGPDRITRTVYDTAGRVQKLQKAYATSFQQDYATYTYTGNGKVASMTDANGTMATMTYDGLDRQTQWNFPSPTNAGSVSTTDYEAYTYDAAGNRTTQRRRDGRTLTFGYDALNRMTSKIVPDGCAPIQMGACAPASATRDVYYGYDLRGLQTYARFDSDSGEGVANGYDALGRLSSSTIAMGGYSRTLSSTYDSDSNRTRVTHPDGQYIDYVREGLDRVYFTGDSTGRPLFYPPYDQQGRVAVLYRLISSTANWGAPTAYGYDPVSRLSLLSTSFTSGSANMSLAFSYNPANQMTAQTRDNDAYAFNGYVNVSRSYGVNGLNQYTSAGAAAFAYDVNGNLVSDGTNSNVYDAENRLISVSGGHNATLTYDPVGRLFSTYSPATGTTQFLYDGDQLTAEYDGAGTMLNRYVHSDGEDDPLVWYPGTGLSSPRYLYSDHQGSITAVADANGAPIGTNAYDEFGIPNAANIGRFQYTGQAWIPELGMFYYKARIYSPTLGRFLQTDPIGYKDQNNLYAYVANDPVNGRDPTGMYDCAGSKGECRAVAALAKGLDAAANSRKISSDQRATLRSASDALGKAGDHNGVTVNFQDLGKTADGKLIMGQADASSNTLTLNTNAISQVAGSQGWKSAFVAGVGAVGHEVRHLQDGSIPSGDYNKRMTTETNGYGVSSSVNQAFGMPGMNGRQIQNGAVASCAQATGQFSACQDSSRHLYPGEYR